jgi:tungstate transport system ATP-binding protein
MSLIELMNLEHSYGGRKILENVNLNVARGEAFALIGPTGSGKTTLLRLIDLLEVPEAGDIYFDGVRVPKSGRQRLDIRRRMTFVLQKPQMFNLTVYDNVAYGLKWRGENKERVKKKVDEMLDLVGLGDYKKRKARTLSGGEAQRVALARALVIEPEVLLLDEPTANLDPVSTEKIEQLISYIASQHDATIIMSTHDMSQGQQLADRIGVLLNGKLVQAGSAGEIFSSPRNKEVANFVGVENILEGVITANDEGLAVVNINGNAIQAISNHPVGEKVYACIRPEDIILALSRSETSARNSVLGKIAKISYTGPVAKIEISCAFRLVALVTKASAEELNLQEGKETYAFFKATAVHLMKGPSL